MMRYSVVPRDQKFVKCYGFLYFAENMDKNIGKIISNLSDKNSQKLFHHAKKSAKDALKTSLKRIIQKAEEATVDLIDDRITKVPKKFQQNNSETVTNEHDKEISKGRHISLEKTQEIIDDLRLIVQ